MIPGTELPLPLWVNPAARGSRRAQRPAEREAVIYAKQYFNWETSYCLHITKPKAELKHAA